MNSSELSKKTAKYKLVKEYILSLIKEGALHPDDRLPTEQELSDRFSISLAPVRKALAELSQEGIIYRIKKKGTFVNQAPAAVPSSPSTLKIVTFILPLSDRTDNNLMQFVRGAQEYFSAHGYSMLIEATDDNIELENTFINKAIKDQLAGLVVFPTSPMQNISSFLKLQQHNIPFVMVDRFPYDLPVNSVVCNNFDGAFQATEHLIHLGHQKIHFLTFVASNQAEQIRYNGYCMALKTHGLDCSYPVYSYQQKQEILQTILTGKSTAFVCANDYCALDILQYLTAEGISIPEQISIVGFDGQRTTEFVTPPLTTVIQPCFAIGHAAAKLLVEKMEGTTPGFTQKVLPIHLEIRKSTAPPK